MLQASLFAPESQFPDGAVYRVTAWFLLFHILVSPCLYDALCRTAAYRISAIRRRPRIIAAPPEVLNEIVAALE